MSVKNKKFASILNGKKGGRPKQDSSIRINLPNIELVILTPAQYGLLIEKYGDGLLNTAISILDSWFKRKSKLAKKYIGKNNYAHFRSDGWVINEAKIKYKHSNINK